MRVYLHSDAAERSASYVVNVSPAGDLEFISAEKAALNPQWTNADGNPKQFQLNFVFGALEVEDSMAVYLVTRGIAHKSRVMRQVRQLFDRNKNPIEEAFDEHGRSVPLHAPA